MKVLIAADGSRYTERVLACLAAHDEWLGPQHDYTVVHGVVPLPHRAAAFLDRAQVRSYYDDDAELVFKPVRAFFATHGIQAKSVLRIGPVAANIARLAAQGRFDLLVMGSHGHGAAAGLVMGSVASKVLSTCKTPVLLVR